MGGVRTSFEEAVGLRLTGGWFSRMGADEAWLDLALRCLGIKVSKA